VRGADHSHELTRRTRRLGWRARPTGGVPAVAPVPAGLVPSRADQTPGRIGRPGGSVGPLVQTAGSVLVPDRSTGKTLIVDPAAGQVVADFSVVEPGSKLELAAKDGLVCCHDLDGAAAGVRNRTGTLTSTAVDPFGSRDTFSGSARW
jgi:hypothetical protein